MIIDQKKWIRPGLNSDLAIEDKVSKILSDIRFNGDQAVDQYSQQFDHQSVRIIPLKPFEDYSLSKELANAILLAAKRIETFALFQKDNGAKSMNFSDEFGEYGQIVSPLNRVGAYVPGGRFPLISTALMTLIPARVAGCPTRIACSPSSHPALLAAASLAGATQFVQVGGVQAIGALAYGYDGECPVDIIVGPGNAWVNEAKKQVQSQVKIDGLAGPSELMALCDANQPIEWLALDALAQAEHDPLACSILVSDNKAWLEKMESYLQSKPESKELLDNKQVELVLSESSDAMIQFANEYAAEHLMLCHEKISTGSLKHFGSLFIGANSAVALGDYISGPNHTLPTLAFAKQNGGLSVSNFQKITTLQEINERGKVELSEQAQSIANSEGLVFHERSLSIRSN